MKDYSGLRIEIKPNSVLGKLLKRTAIRLRYRSNARATSVVKYTVDQWMGYAEKPIHGTFTVRPNTQTISFKGEDKLGVNYEYVYGKLTITKAGVYVPQREAIKLFTNFLKRVNGPFEYIESNSVKVTE